MPSVKIDKEKCIGCGLCESMCSEVFELRDDEKAHVKNQSGCKSGSCDCKDVAASCPVQAITYEE